MERAINGYTLLTEAIHPVTKEIYKIGDNVVINDDNIICGSGRDYIITIKTMFTTSDSEYIYIADEEYKDSEYRRRHWASRPTGIYLNEVKRKINDKEIEAINKAKALARQYV